MIAYLDQDKQMENLPTLSQSTNKEEVIINPNLLNLSIHHRHHIYVQ